MKKIFIATPAFSGQVTVPYALSLAELTLALKANNYEVIPQVVTSGSLLVAERNRLTEAFWQSGCDYMLCIDGDLGYPAQAVLAMLEQNKEFICGVYPARGADLHAFTFRPCKNEDESIVQDKHLLKMEYVPAGFMLISRSAIEKMRNKYPELYYSPKHSKDNSESAYCFFDTEVRDGEFWGEDYVFCRRAREAGIEIWCDPLIEFDHAGTRGMLLNVLADKNGKKIAMKEESCTSK
jgi:hypothetical protein